MKKNKASGIIGYSYSLIIDHLFALLASLVVTNIINFFSKSGIPTLNLIICVCIYFSICYLDSWQRGCADRNRMHLGLISKNKLRGAFAGFIAAIPGFLLAFFAFIAEIDLIEFYDVFKVDVFTTINRLWHLPLSTLYVFVNEKPILNLLFPLFLPIASEIGYIMGIHEITFKRIFIYKNNTDDEADE